jgi:oligopeptide transport system substrate-binding protein
MNFQNPICAHLRSFAAFVIAIAALVGCGRHSTNTKTAAVLRYPISLEPLSLDPAVLNETPTLEMLQNVFEGLVTFDMNNKVIPCLAEKWEISRDGKSYTFHLRARVEFHNGRTLTSQDVKWSLERSLWPSTRSGVAANYLEGIVGAKEVASGKRKDLSGIRIIDEHTIVITLDRPRGYFLGSLVYPTGWVLCKEAITANDGRVDKKAVIGTGPFRFGGLRGSHYLLLANREYWGGRPPLDGIERPIVKDPQVAHVMYENNEVDICTVTPGDFLNDQKNPKLKSQIHVAPQAVVDFLTMHPRLEPVFKDKRVRQAIAKAIDKDEIIRIASHGVWERADRFLPPGIPGSDPNSPKQNCDPVAAQKLLAAADFPGGKGFPKITLVYAQSSPAIASTAQLIRDQLRRNLGITIDLQERDGATLRAELLSERVAFTIGDWGADYIDPQNFLSMLLRSGARLNFFGYSNPQFDALCDKADAETDMARRIPLYQKADRMAMEEVALLPLIYGTARILVKPYVQGLERNSMALLPHYRTRIVRR